MTKILIYNKPHKSKQREQNSLSWKETKRPKLSTEMLESLPDIEAMKLKKQQKSGSFLSKNTTNHLQNVTKSPSVYNMDHKMSTPPSIKRYHKQPTIPPPTTTATTTATTKNLSYIQKTTIEILLFIDS